MYNPFTLENKTILVTGASSGIGKCTAIECSKLGARVIVTARNEERLSATFSLLEGEGHQCIVCDINNQEQVNDMIGKLPEIQGVVNNAGITIAKPIQFIKEEILSNIIQTNTISPILLLQKLLKKKVLKKNASVVFTSSIAATGEVTVGNSMYVASKGGITSFIRCAALELGAKQIRVNAVCPGMVDTPLIHGGDVTAEQLAENEKLYPLGRFGKPEDIAWAIIYLLSDASNWVTGINMIVDGGFSVHA